MNLDQGIEGQRFARSADIAATIAAVTRRGDFMVTDEPGPGVPGAAAGAAGACRSVRVARARPRAHRRGHRDVGAEVRRPASVVLCERPLPDRYVRSDPGWTRTSRPIKVYGRGGDAPQVDVRARPTRDLVQARRGPGGLHPDADARSTSAGRLRLTGFALDRRELTRNGNVGVTYEWEASRGPPSTTTSSPSLSGRTGRAGATRSLSFGGRGVGVTEWTAGPMAVPVLDVRRLGDGPGRRVRLAGRHLRQPRQGRPADHGR